jgi:hypothetical protein
MELTRFLLLLARGGLVSLVIHVFLNLLKPSQSREDAEDESLWENLLHPGSP